MSEILKFVFDLDGTICFKNQPISKEILYPLSELEAAGIEVIFASARPIRDMLPVIDEAFHHYTMIGGNGSLIFKDGKVIKSNAFTQKEINEIKNLFHQYNATYLIDSAWDYAFTGPDTHPFLQNIDPGNLAQRVSVESLESVVKILLISSTNMSELAERLMYLKVNVNHYSNENVLDISPSGINKWSALKALGVEDNTYVAFGNDSNDISMFENALHSVMVGFHEHLAPFAKENISLSSNVEMEIAHKIRMLSKEFSVASIKH